MTIAVKLLNGQTGVQQGCGTGMARVRARAQWRHGGHKGHTSLKFEKDGGLTKRASGVPKLIADKNLRKSTQGGA